MGSLLKNAPRKTALALLFWLPEARRIRIERWLRGRKEARRLERADVAVVSFGKSGRTWLRVMMSRYYQQVHGIPAGLLLGFTNYHARAPQIPKIFFTHDNYIKDYTGEANRKASFYGKKVVLLVRNPKDIAVSQYFQWQHRMRPEKKRLNGYPPHGAEVSVFEFVMNETVGLPGIIDYLNLWARESNQVAALLVVRYEDMRADPTGALTRVMEFIDERPAQRVAIDEAVEYASVENMRELEASSAFGASGSRMRPGKPEDPNSYKVRRAKVGGYKDYFTGEETERIDQIVDETLIDDFGYAGPSSAS